MNPTQIDRLYADPAYVVKLERIAELTRELVTPQVINHNQIGDLFSEMEKRRQVREALTEAGY